MGPSALKAARPIVRVNVADMNRTDGARYYGSGSHADTAGSQPGGGGADPGYPYMNGAKVFLGQHFTSSIAGFGRACGNKISGSINSSSIDGVATHFRGILPIQEPESEWESYSPMSNLNVRKDMLKALYGFETSFFIRDHHRGHWLHPRHNGTRSTSFRARFGRAEYGGPFYMSSSMPHILDRVSRAHLCVRGMRYGIDNYIPTEDKSYVRHDRHGQFRDTLEQRKFHVTCGAEGFPNPDRPVLVKFVARGATPGAEGTPNIDPIITNSQNLSIYATASLPYFDDWEFRAVPAAWRYGRDRSTAHPDARPIFPVIQLPEMPDFNVPSFLF